MPTAVNPSKNHTYNKLTKLPIDSNFDVSDEIGKERKAEIEKIYKAQKDEEQNVQTTYLSEDNIFSILTDENSFSAYEKSEFKNDSNFFALMKQLGGKLEFVVTDKGSSSKKEIKFYDENPKLTIPPGTIVGGSGGEYAGKTKFSFEELNKKTGISEKKSSKNPVTKEQEEELKAKSEKLKKIQESLKQTNQFQSPEGFLKKIRDISSKLSAANDEKSFQNILSESEALPIIKNLLEQSKEILDEKKYTLGYRKYFLQQSLDLIEAQAETVVLTLSKISAQNDIHTFINEAITQSKKVIKDLETDFKKKIKSNIEKVNQIEKTQVQRLFSEKDPLSVAEKSPAMKNFESRILTSSQLSNILKKELTSEFISSLNSMLTSSNFSQKINSGADGKYYSNDVRAIIDEYRNSLAEKEKPELESFIGSKLDDHILSSDQTSLMLQFEDMLLDINEQQFTAKAFAILATGAGKSFLAGLTTNYKEEIINSWNFSNKIIEKDNYSQDELNFIGEKQQFFEQAEKDKDYINKIAIQKSIAESGLKAPEKEGDKKTLENVKENFQIEIINLANQNQINKILESKNDAKENDKKPLKGKVYFIDERLYYEDQTSYSNVSNLSHLGAKVILFGANENKILLHQRLQRLLKKQENLDAEIKEQFYPNSDNENDSVQNFDENDSVQNLGSSLVSGSLVTESSKVEANKKNSVQQNPTKQISHEIIQQDLKTKIEDSDKQISHETIQQDLKTKIEDSEKNIKNLEKLKADGSDFFNKEETKKEILEVFIYQGFLSQISQRNNSKNPINKEGVLKALTDAKAAKAAKDEISNNENYDDLRNEILEEMENSFNEFKLKNRGNYITALKEFKSSLTEKIDQNKEALNNKISKINQKAEAELKFSLLEDEDKNNDNISSGFDKAVALMKKHQKTFERIEKEIESKTAELTENKKDKRKLDLFFVRKSKIESAEDAIKKVEIREGNVRQKIESSKLSFEENLSENIKNLANPELFSAKKSDEAKSESEVKSEAEVKSESESEAKVTRTRTQHIIPGLKILDGIKIADENKANLSKEQSELIKNLKEIISNRGGVLLANFVTNENKHACVVIIDDNQEEYYQDQDPNFLGLLDQISEYGEEVTMLYAGDYEYVVGGDYGPLSKLIKERGDKQYIYITREEDIDINNFEQFIGRNRSSGDANIEIKIDQSLASRLQINSRQDLVKFAVENRFKKNLTETTNHLHQKLTSYLKRTGSNFNIDEKLQVIKENDSDEINKIIIGENFLQIEDNELNSVEYLNGMASGVFSEQDKKFNQVLRPYLFYQFLSEELKKEGRNSINLEEYHSTLKQNNFSAKENEQLILKFDEYEKSNQILAELSKVPFTLKSQEEVKEFKEKIKEKRKEEAKNIQKTNEDLSKQIAAINKTIEEIEAQKAALEKEEKEEKDLETSVNNKKQTLNSSNDELKALSDQLEQNKKELTSRQGEILTLKNHINSLKTKNLNSKKEGDELDNKLENLKLKFEKISSEKNSVSENQKISDQLENLKQQNELLQKIVGNISSSKNPSHNPQHPNAYKLSSPQQQDKFFIKENFSDEEDKENAKKIPNDFWLHQFSGCTFENVDFSEVKNLEYASFKGCVFGEGCKFPENFKFPKNTLVGNNIFHKTHENCLSDDGIEIRKNEISEKGIEIRKNEPSKEEKEANKANKKEKFGLFYRIENEKSSSEAENTGNKKTKYNTKIFDIVNPEKGNFIETYVDDSVLTNFVNRKINNEHGVPNK